MGVRWIERLRRRSVIVHTKDGGSISGLLVGTYTDSLVLAHGMHLGVDSHVKIDGDAVIPRDNVAWIQDLPATTEANQ